MDYFITRFCLQKSLAFLYCIGFLIVIRQYRALLGSHGILPVENFVKKVRFWDAPSLFFFFPSDRYLQITGWAGLILSFVALTGISEMYGLVVSMGVWFCLWALYQSFVNVGQIFYSYGWELLLLESGFLAIFLGSSDTAPPVIMIWLYRWVLFRVMFGAGLIKIRCDSCWKDLTSLLFHYETQPLPGPFSRFFHRFPIFIHKSAVIFNHFIELVVPIFLFGPSIVATVAGLFLVLFQSILISSGNFAWLNFVTLALCFSAFSDSFLSVFIPVNVPYNLPSVGWVHLGLVIILLCLIGYLSIKPIRNMLSRHQVMNRSFDPLNCVNTYGAFGTVTRIRKEIIIEGTSDEVITENTQWFSYEFKAKPGDVRRRPPQVSPYHYKIDWQMWFAAMSSYQQHYWFLPFMKKILEGNEEVLSLLKTNPFPDKPPKYLRAEWYEYHFAPPENKEGVFWTRKRLGEYMPPIYLICNYSECFNDNVK